MALQQAIEQVLEGLPVERVREVLDFARFLAHASEPEYREADLLPRSTP